MIKLIKSTFYKEEETKKKLIDFIKSADYLSFGPQCKEFEKRFADYQGRKRCLFFNSGSSANLSLIQALLNLGRIKPGDNIGFSAVTWATNAMPLIQLALNPIPVDIEIDTLNVSSKKLAKVLRGKNIKALFLTNLLGLCDDIDRIQQICRNKNIILIEDNCESLGTIYNGRKLGNFGLASTFSFYVGHHLSTIEGGAVCTDEQELATMLSIVRAHGWDRNLDNGERKELRNRFHIQSDFFAKYTFYDLGYNLRPTEITGFLGNKQLDYIDEIVRKRSDNFMKIAPLIYKKNNLYHPIHFTHIEFLSSFAIPIICKSKEIKEKVIKNCKEKIEIRPIVGGDITQQPFFKKYKKELSQDNPGARLIHELGLYFGNNPELTEEEIYKIIYVFTKE